MSLSLSVLLALTQALSPSSIHQSADIDADVDAYMLRSMCCQFVSAAAVGHHDNRDEHDRRPAHSPRDRTHSRSHLPYSAIATSRHAVSIPLLSGHDARVERVCTLCTASDDLSCLSTSKTLMQSSLAKVEEQLVHALDRFNQWTRAHSNEAIVRLPVVAAYASLDLPWSAPSSSTSADAERVPEPVSVHSTNLHIQRDDLVQQADILALQSRVHRLHSDLQLSRFESARMQLDCSNEVARWRTAHNRGTRMRLKNTFTCARRRPSDREFECSEATRFTDELRVAKELRLDLSTSRRHVSQLENVVKNHDSVMHSLFMQQIKTLIQSMEVQWHMESMPTSTEDVVHICKPFKLIQRSPIAIAYEIDTARGYRSIDLPAHELVAFHAVQNEMRTRRRLASTSMCKPKSIGAIDREWLAKLTQLHEKCEQVMADHNHEIMHLKPSIMTQKDEALVHRYQTQIEFNANRLQALKHKQLQD